MFELSTKSVENLRSFITGRLSLDGLYEWLVESEYDDTLSQDERDTLASIRLAALEATEGTCTPWQLEASTLGLLKASVGSHVEDGVDLTMKPYLRKVWYSYAWEESQVDALDIRAAFPSPAPLVTPAAYLIEAEASTPAGGVVEFVS